MELWVQKIEAILRVCATLVLVLTACLVGLDSQTKVLVYLKKEVTFRSLHSLVIVLYIDSAAAAYNLLQLSSIWLRGKSKGSSRYLAWFCYLLDQVVVYTVFGANSAAVEHALMVRYGVDELQWTKWCNKYSRFCVQIGGAIVCGYVACAIMVLITSISAFNLFRFYSPKQFLLSKVA